MGCSFPHFHVMDTFLMKVAFSSKPSSPPKRIIVNCSPNVLIFFGDRTPIAATLFPAQLFIMDPTIDTALSPLCLGELEQGRQSTPVHRCPSGALVWASITSGGDDWIDSSGNWKEDSESKTNP